jgi:membrane protein DedA with SNARE-associated domain
MDLIGLIEPLMTSPEFYPVVFGLAAADVLFPIIPSEGAVIAAGVFAAAGAGPNLLLVMGLAAAGAFVGDHIAYGLGRSVLGPRLIRRSARLRTAVDAISRQLDRRGGTLIVTSRFIPGGRTAVTAACGTSRYPLRRFSKAAAIAAVLWAIYCGLIGFIGGTAFTANPVLGLAVGMGLAFGLSGAAELVRHLRKKRSAPGEFADQGHEELILDLNHA